MDAADAAAARAAHAERVFRRTIIIKCDVSNMFNNCSRKEMFVSLHAVEYSRGYKPVYRAFYIYARPARIHLLRACVSGARWSLR